MSRQVREAPYDLVGLLDHRELVFAHGNERRTHRGDVGRLADRVHEKTGGDGALEPSKRDLFPHCGISLEPLLKAARRGPVTLVFSSHDIEHNAAVALRDYLKTQAVRRVVSWVLA
jgi:hypothetical protein